LCISHLDIFQKDIQEMRGWMSRLTDMILNLLDLMGAPKPAECLNCCLIGRHSNKKRLCRLRWGGASLLILLDYCGIVDYWMYYWITVLLLITWLLDY
jgi:hypothetical protein